MKSIMHQGDGRRKVWSQLVLALSLAWGMGLLGGCVAIPKGSYQGGHIIEMGPGTEDMVLDTLTGSPRLLVSCDDRRHGNRPTFSGICSYNLVTNRVDTMEVHEYPFGMVFRPHGLDFQVVRGKPHLYVVCHDDSAGHHWIADFEVYDRQLMWIQNYQGGALTSPNGVTALPSGDLYVTNDHLVRGSVKESFFKKKVADIIHFRPDASHEVAFHALAYGNGITQRDGYVYAAATVENAVYRFKILPDGKLGEQERYAKVHGPDNLRWDGQDLLVACHLRLIKFLGHAKDAKKRSPTTVYRISPGVKKPIPLYSDKGDLISGGATGLIWRGRLFVGQVFENWIIEATK